MDDPKIRYDLSIGEGGGKAHLLIDFKAMRDAGGTDDEIVAATDEVSERVLDSMTSEYSVDEPGLLRLAIG